MAPNPEDRIESTEFIESEDDLEFEPVRVPRKSKGSKWGMVFALFVLSGIIAGGGWFIYGSYYQNPSQIPIPIIHADIAPIKIKPADPGGLEIPDRDKLVYNRLKGESAGSVIENLLPPPEELLEKPEAVTPESAPPELLKNPENTDITSAESLMEAEPVIPVIKEPVSLEPVALEPGNMIEDTESTALSEETVAPPPVPEPESEPETVQETQPVVSVPEETPVPTPTVSSTEPTVSSPSVNVAETPEPVVTMLSTDSTVYRIQLAALRTEERAKIEWKRLLKAFPEILGNMKKLIVRADLGEDKGVFYRLRAGSMDNKSEAKAICTELSKLNQGCMVIRPGK